MDDKTKMTLCDMLQDRGYVYIDIESNEQVFQHHTNNTTIGLVYIEAPKMGVNEVKQVDTFLQQNVTYSCIIVYNNTITPFAKSALEVLVKDGFHINLFSTKELLFNITRHKLVPKHTLLSLDEKQELLQFYKVKEQHMPIISMVDPVAKYYGAKKGEVFRIERASDTTRTSIYYRLVT